MSVAVAAGPAAGPVWRLARLPLTAVRHVFWRIRARRIRNPRLTSARSVLFVCKGNICRSPYAAMRAEQIAAQLGLAALKIGSAGIQPSQDNACPAEAVAAAREYGLRLDGHVPSPLDRDVVAAHDAVVLMEAAQQSALRRRFPEFRDRFVLLSLFDPQAGSAYERCNILDPFGKSAHAFEACYRRIDASLWTMLPAITGGEDRSTASVPARPR